VPGRTVIEVQPRRLLVREYDRAGHLLGVHLQPQSVGPAAPAPGPMPRPPRAGKAKRAATPPPPAPEPAPEPTPEPAPAPLPLLEVVTEPFEPAPRRLEVLPARAPRVALAPTLVERALEAAAWQEAPREAPPPAPRTFEIVSIERVVVAPPVPIAIPEPEPAPEVEPVRVEVQGPEPEPAAPVAVEIEVTPIEEPAPVLLRDRVPDLDARVDALLREREGAPRPRRRRPLDVPRFDPLRREPWEDRLDAALSG